MSPRQCAAAGAELIGLQSHLLHHRHEQIAERRVVGAIKFDVAAVIETSAGHDQRQVLPVVRIRVSKIASKEHHRIIDQSILRFGF